VYIEKCRNYLNLAEAIYINREIYRKFKKICPKVAQN
jgi:hypothetical protein